MPPSSSNQYDSIMVFEFMAYHGHPTFEECKDRCNISYDDAVPRNTSFFELTTIKMKVGFIALPDFVYQALVFLHFVVKPIAHVDSCLFVICCWLACDLNAMRNEFQIQFQNMDNAHSIHVQLLKSPPRRLLDFEWQSNGYFPEF